MSDLNEQQPVEREAPEVLGQSDIDAFANQTPVGANKAHQKAKGKSRRKLTTWIATLAAVAVWKSPPERKDSRIASSPAMCASRRSSIWE